MIGYEAKPMAISRASASGNSSPVETLHPKPSPTSEAVPQVVRAL